MLLDWAWICWHAITDDTEEEDESDDNIEYWLNDALEKINLTSDSSENECVVFSLITTLALIWNFLKLGDAYCTKKRMLI